jgi:hypothetical protein
MPGVAVGQGFTIKLALPGATPALLSCTTTLSSVPVAGAVAAGTLTAITLLSVCPADTM